MSQQAEIPPRSRSDRFVRIGAANSGVTIAIAATALVTTPYLLTRLGRASYGVFALTGAVAAQVANLELGFGYSTIRYLASARAEGDKVAERHILNTSLTVFLAAAVVGSAGILLASRWLTFTYADVPNDLLQATEVAFQVSAASVGVSFLLSYVRVVLQATERFGPIIVFQLVAGVASTAVAVATVALGGGLVAVVVGQLVVVVLTLLGLAAAWAVGPERLPVPLPVPNVPTLRKMARFGVTVFAGGVGYQLFLSGPLVVLGGVVPAAAIPVFSIPWMIVQRCIQAASSASVALLPFLSAASARNEHAALRIGFLRHLRVSWLAGGAGASFLVVMGEPMMTLWLGPDLGRPAARSLAWLAVAFALIILSIGPAEMARARAHAAGVSAYTWGLAVVALALAVALGRSNGPEGAAMAVCAAAVLSTPPLILWGAHSALSLPPVAVVAALARPTLLIVALAAALAAGRQVISTAAIEVMVGSAVAIGSAAIAFFSVLNSHERNAFRSLARRRSKV